MAHRNAITRRLASVSEHLHSERAWWAAGVVDDVLREIESLRAKTNYEGVAMVELFSVYAMRDEASRVLYELLKEREPYQSISHRALPAFVEHDNFVRSKPYDVWYLIAQDGQKPFPTTFVGATYLTKAREVGLFIFNEHQGKGYGTAALDSLMKRHPGRFYANISPQNERSSRFFQKHGFNLIQHTYERPNPSVVQ